MPLPRLFALAALCALLAAPAEAQRFTQHARAAVEAPQVLARGGAGVAFASPEAALFYNPAQLAHLSMSRPRVELLSVQGGASTKLFGDVGFIRDEVAPAIERGFESPLSDEDRALFERALDRGGRPTVGRAAVTLPQVTFRAGGIGISAGAFAANTTRYQFEDLGGGVPLLDLFSQADLIGAVGMGARLPESPLAVGVTGRYARRFIGYKHKDLLAMSPETEQLYVIGGQTVAFDLGFHAEDVSPELPGRLDVGFAVYDLIGGGFTYALERTVELTGEPRSADPELERVLAAFEERDGARSFRAGAAYHLGAVGPLRGAVVAVDYLSASTSESAQPALSKLRLGAEARLAGFLALRGGLGQGYPAAGVGIETRFARIDYGFFGEEDGRLPGQLERFSHLLQVRIGLF